LDGDAEAIRELGINMKKIGIHAAQCAEGFLISSIMKKLGINVNQFKSFINEIYQYCQRFGLVSQDIASLLETLIKLSKEVPFSKIPDHIEEKKKEISKLDEQIRERHEDIKTLEETKETLEMETSAAKELHDSALQGEKIITAKLKKCWNLIEKLEKHGLDIYDDEDISKFVKLIKNLREEYGFNAKEVISEFQDLQSLKLQLEYLPNRVNELVKRKLMLEQNCVTLENRISVHYQKLSLIDELRSMGLGFNYLKLLCNTIREIAAENGISYKVAIEQFIEWVEKLYGAIKLRQNVQEQEQPEYAKLDNNLTTTYPYYYAIKPFTALPELLTLEEKERERQREQMRTSIYYSYTKINTKSKTTEEEESNRSDNDNHDGDIYDG
jgi:chromosome segregation ATPase